jgi:dienelactone hydrolase
MGHLSRYFFIGLCCFVSGLGSVGSVGLERRGVDSFIHHNIEKLPFGNLLELLYRDSLSLDGSSSPTASILKLYDGVQGELENRDSFLVFDGKFVRLTLDIPAWRKPDSISFTALEFFNSPASVRLVFDATDGVRREVALNRTIIERSGSVAVVEYSSSVLLSLPAGNLDLSYQVNGIANPHLGEFVLDEIKPTAFKQQASKRNPSLTDIHSLPEWLEVVGNNDCSRVSEEYAPLHSGPTREKLKLLFGQARDKSPIKIVYLQKFRDEDSSTEISSLIIKLDNTGDTGLDFIKAWLVVPDKNRNNLPLVILPQQGHVYSGMEAVGLFGEKELGVAGALADQGVASLTLNSFRFGNTNQYMLPIFFDTYPNSGTTAKDLENIYRVLDAVTDYDFQFQQGYEIDNDRIGIWGFSYGAWISMLAGLMDERITAVSFSSFHYHDRDIAYGLSSALYIPQLSCLDNWENPISVGKMLGEFQRDVFAVAPDSGVAAAWRENLQDEKVQIVINPYGHVVTEYERAEVLNFFYKKFSINAEASPRGPSHQLPIDALGIAPYYERETRWREALIKAIRAEE